MVSNSDKYDRQLRLWGEDGQAKLEKAHVCLINGSATGCETLKNLVLPGIGAFTIVDGNKTEPADLGNNFFLDTEGLGQPRALRTTELLRELNDRVKGYSVEEDPVELINSKTEFFESFTVVIAVNLAEAPLRKLASFLYERVIPLVVVRSYGFIGYLRLVTPEHTIIESKPDNPSEDLRFYSPFPELQKFADAVTFEGIDSAKHAHIPFAVILIRLLDQWRKEHDGKAPETRADKDAFKKKILEMANHPDEENFREAHKYALKAVTPSRIPDDVQQILRDEKAVNVSDKSDEFWVLAAALKEFVENEGKGELPLSGSIPDMTADTTSYINLQRVYHYFYKVIYGEKYMIIPRYHEKAASDIAAVAARVDAIIARTNRPRGHTITPDNIKKFCKNARFLKVLRLRSLEEEYSTETAKSAAIASDLEQPDNNLTYYVLLHAVDRFYAVHSRYPGYFDDNLQMETDISTLKTFVNAILTELSIPTHAVKDEPIHEMCRFGASELHNIASLMGGVASEEIIKLITHQYEPVNNTFIYNGINSTSTSLIL